LVSAEGKDLPLQTEILATWDPEGQWVRWLLVDSPVRVREHRDLTLRLQYGPGVSGPHPGEPVDPEQSPWPPEEILRSLYMIDHRGREYSAALDDEAMIEVETRGPLRTVVRAHVWHRDDAGDRLCRAILRLHYYAGLEQVRVFHSFVTNPGHYLGGTLPYPGAEFARLVSNAPFERAFEKVMEDLLLKMPLDGQSAYYMPGMIYIWEKTGDPAYLAYCRLCFQWYTHCLVTKGHADLVRRLVFGFPEFPYGMVSGYLAAGLAGLAEARQQGIDLEAAAEDLRAARAEALGQDPADALCYSIYGTVEGQPGTWQPGPTEPEPHPHS